MSTTITQAEWDRKAAHGYAHTTEAGELAILVNQDGATVLQTVTISDPLTPADVVLRKHPTRPGEFVVQRRAAGAVAIDSEATIGHLRKYRQRTPVLVTDCGVTYSVGTSEATRWAYMGMRPLDGANGYRTRAQALEALLQDVNR